MLFPVTGTREILRWMSFSVIIGVVAGLGALLFTTMLDLSDSFFLGTIAQYHPPVPGGERNDVIGQTTRARRLLLLILPALGGLLSGLIVYTFAPEAEGHGTDAVIDAFHNKRGRIRPVVPFIKIIASALTIGTGGSAGREGPIAQIGAGFGSFMGQKLGLSVAETRHMLIIGAGAGIGAIFHAPLGGAIFAATVLYRETDYEHGTLMPGFIAAIVAYAVYTSLAGTPYAPIFTFQGKFVFTPVQLPFYLLLGVLTVPLCIGYIKTFYGMRDHVFRKIKLPRHLIPALGGLMVGVIALFFPAVLGTSYGWIQEAIDGKTTVMFLIALSVLKIIATSFTISSGGSGGVFAPSLVIGGAFGGVIGALLHQINPTLAPEPASFVLVGMAAFFAAVAKVPIASLIMVSEMTGGYALIIPAMLAIAAAYMLSGNTFSIYEKQVNNRFSSPAHRGNYIIDVLQEITAGEVFSEKHKVITIHEHTNLAEILEMYETTDQSVFPVVSKEGKYRGFVPIDLLRGFPREPETARLIIAYDIMEKGPAVRPEEDLNRVLQRLMVSGVNELPIVSHEGKVMGLLSRRELLTAYYHRMQEVRKS